MNDITPSLGFRQRRCIPKKHQSSANLRPLYSGALGSGIREVDLF